MDRLIYTAMTGASHTLQQQASVSQNLANVNTPGFRSTIDTFRSVPLVGEGLPTRTFVVDSTSGTDFTPGVMQTTGRTLDVAIDGKGWIAVQDANGNEAYTRNGSLQVLPNGILQTSNGLNVVGDAGPITIPPDTQVTIAKDGTISTVPSQIAVSPSGSGRSAQADQSAGRSTGARRRCLVPHQGRQPCRCRRQCDRCPRAAWKAAT